MSTVDSSGIAAPLAQSRQPGELGISLASYPDDLKNGANNLKLMLARVYNINNETLYRFGEHIDGRDYRAIAFEIESAISANLLRSSDGTREGFLRAFADLLSIVVDGCGLPTPWDPIATTAAAFAVEGEAA